jgi:putative hydrolase of the HAD superfamily
MEAFAAVVDSSQAGVRKPDPRIFAITADRMGCPPGELLFFDDTAENVTGAVAAGMVGRLFEDAEVCRRTCEEYGLV